MQKALYELHSGKHKSVEFPIVRACWSSILCRSVIGSPRGEAHLSARPAAHTVELARTTAAVRGVELARPAGGGPFGTAELAARLRSCLGRVAQQEGEGRRSSVKKNEATTVDFLEDGDGGARSRGGGVSRGGGWGRRR
jgi:hypothetical protein